MRLMSKLANSRLSRAGIIATGVGSSFVPTYEMLNPPAIYAEQIEQSPNLEELLSNLSTQENRDEALLRAFEEGKQGKIPHGSNLIDEVVNVLFKGYHPDFLDITDIISLYKRIGTISTNLPSKEEKVKLYTLASRRYEELVEKLIKELMKLRNPTHIPYAEVVGFGRSAELYEKAENSSKAKELYKKSINGGMNLAGREERRDLVEYLILIAEKVGDNTAIQRFSSIAMEQAEKEGKYNKAAEWAQKLGDSRKAEAYGQLHKLFSK